MKITHLPSIRKARISSNTLEVLEARVAPATVVAVDTSNNLLSFDTATPGTVTPIGAITGLQTGETILGMDYRPADLNLYALGSTGRLYTINTATAAATLVAALAADPVDQTNPFTSLSGTEFGVDFNPVVDRLRVVSDAEQNLRVNPATGGTVTDGDLNGVGIMNPNVTGAAYTNSVAGATGTTLYDIDTANDTLVIQNPPNNGTLTVVGALGVNTSELVGFDIRATTEGNVGYASLTSGTGSSFYTINLSTGATTLVGAIGGGSLSIRDLAIAPETVLISANGKTATFTDVDGDKVTIKVSKGTLKASDFTLLPNAEGTGAQLLSINFQDDDADGDGVGDFEGANLTITAKRGTSGDGFVNVGYINSTGFDLGKVVVDGDLGQIDAGDSSSTKKLDVVSITAHSIGRFGTSTQFGTTASLESNIVGKLGALTLRSDLSGAFINVTDVAGSPDSASIGRVTIGGDLEAGATANSGSIQSAGPIGRVLISGDLIGGPATYTGAIVTTGNGTIGNVTIGGNILGGSDQLTGIFSDGTIGSVKVGGEIHGVTPTVTAKIIAEGIASPESVRQALAIGNVTVGRSVENAEILAGFSISGAPSNADVQIGKVTVGLDFVTSSISAGITRGTDGFFASGDAGEGVIGGGSADIVSRIAGIAIRGQVIGTPPSFNATDSYGFSAQQIGSFTVGDTRIPLSPSSTPDDVVVGTTGDVRIREYV